MTRLLILLALGMASAMPQTSLDALVDASIKEEPAPTEAPKPPESLTAAETESGPQVSERQSYFAPVQPEIPVCGIEYDCVPPELCLPNGDIDVFGVGGIDVRLGPGQNGGADNDTVASPSEPEATVAERSGQGYFGGFSYVPDFQCDLGGGYQGRCCRKPRLDGCPDNSICVVGWHCPSWDGSEFIDLRQHPRACTHPSGAPHSVCCARRSLFPPVPQTCGVRNPDGVYPLVPHDSYAIDARIQTPADNLLDSEAKFGEFPWQALLFKDSPDGFQFLAGGVLVSTRHVLTVAHHVFDALPGQLQVRLGEWEVNALGEPIEYQDYYVSAVYVHPNYKPKSGERNDFAILVLDRDVYITNNVHMACLPTDPYQSFDGNRCLVSGWGKDAFYGNYQAVMKRVDLPMVPNGICQKLLRDTPRLSRYFQLHKSFVCAGGEPEKDACTGDGGGPLICPVNGHYVVAGLTSWGIGCGQANVPGVYASTAYALEWIREVMSRDPHVVYPNFVPHHGQGGIHAREGEGEGPAPAAQEGASSADLLDLLGDPQE